MIMSKHKKIDSRQHLSQVIITTAVFSSTMSNKHQGPKWKIKVKSINLEQIETNKGEGKKQIAIRIVIYNKHVKHCKVEVKQVGENCSIEQAHNVSVTKGLSTLGLFITVLNVKIPELNATKQ